jgi:thiamine pyrophosphokinase
VVTTGADPDTVRAEAAGTAMIAADGGLDTALAAGLSPELVVGDLDSASPSGLAQAERLGIPIARHPVDKDATDLELALDEAAARSPGRVLVLGSGGGRLDHLLAAVASLASARYAGVELDAILGSARIHVVRDERTLSGSPGEIVTLLAFHGPAEGVDTEGLRFPLRGETLEPGSSRGVSNVFASGEARITLTRGVLVAVRPGAEEASR